MIGLGEIINILGYGSLTAVLIAASIGLIFWTINQVMIFVNSKKEKKG